MGTSISTRGGVCSHISRMLLKTMSDNLASRDQREEEFTFGAFAWLVGVFGTPLELGKWPPNGMIPFLRGCRFNQTSSNVPMKREIRSLLVQLFADRYFVPKAEVAVCWNFDYFQVSVA